MNTVEPEYEDEEGTTRRKPTRTGVFTSAIVARPHIGAAATERPVIVLFFTGRKHAGENLRDTLALREEQLSAPIHMCDALSRNAPGDFKRLLANCIPHGRRKFVEVFSSFPDECRYVLESLRVPQGTLSSATNRSPSAILSPLAQVVELADTRDSKSRHLTVVRVQFPPWAWYDSAWCPEKVLCPKATDSKSVRGNSVWVRLPPPAERADSSIPDVHAAPMIISVVARAYGPTSMSCSRSAVITRSRRALRISWSMYGLSLYQCCEGMECG